MAYRQILADLAIGFSLTAKPDDFLLALWRKSVRTRTRARRTIFQTFLTFGSIAVEPLVDSPDADALGLGYFNRP
jgi:hypothetical protein